MPAGRVPGSVPWRDDVRGVRPMLAAIADVGLDQQDFVYEPKYDGVRTLASIEPGHPKARVRLFSRLGNEKTAQFPEIVQALERFGRGLKAPLVLDGEVVALDDRGEPASFQRLQGRLHVKSVAAAAPVAMAFVAFDLLREGSQDLRGLPLTARRAALERVFVNPGSPRLRLAPQTAGHGESLYREAVEHGWEGVIAKRASSRYLSGKRSSDWAKLKLQHAQEFVVGGWTAPRGTRSGFGALILGVYDAASRLVYVGHVGTGFDGRELDRVMAKLAPLAVRSSPFDVPPPATNDTPHWVKPELVAEVKFTEWTDDNRLRHPTYLGLRDDVKPRTVRREPEPKYSAASLERLGVRAGQAPAARPSSGRAASSRPSAAAPPPSPPPAPSRALQLVVDQLTDLEQRRRKGRIVLPDGDTLQVSNLDKVFWPKPGLTKGDLLRYYVRVSPFLLPVVRDRPLVMKRYPNGVTDEAFYQHRAPDPLPDGIRAETLPDDDVPSRLVGGSLKTLLYLGQLAAISQDPWFSRVQSPHLVDHIAFDLDPMPGVSFATVLDVARWVRDELGRVGAVGFPKTSGSDGLHVFVPMPKRTAYDTALLWAQIVATMVAMRHPKVATVERTVKKRGATVYVDYLQNIEGKTLACAYSARASEFAGASTPLTWDEVEDGVDRRDFTIQTLPARLAEVGDLWKPLLKHKGVDLRKAIETIDD
ncbi:MAG TPA: DNA ligase D [Methylomirabilota bacterium]